MLDVTYVTTPTESWFKIGFGPIRISDINGPTHMRFHVRDAIYRIGFEKSHRPDGFIGMIRYG